MLWNNYSIKGAEHSPLQDAAEPIPALELPPGLGGLIGILRPL